MFVIDYIIVHELAHLNRANHTPSAKKALDAMEKYIEQHGMSGAGDVLRAAAPEIWKDIYWRDNNDSRTRMDVL